MTIQLQVVQHGEDELTWREGIIEQHLRSFVIVGEQLKEIRDRDLYKDQGYRSWADYVDQRWSAFDSKTHADRLILASDVTKRLTPIGVSLPLAEAQVRPLTALPASDQPIVWKRAVDSAPKDPKSGVPKVTAKHVETTRDAYLAERTFDGDTEDDDLLSGSIYTIDAWHALSDDERSSIIADAPVGSSTKFNATTDRVEWAHWTWNPVTGCDHGCDYCYARVLAKRYYLDLPEDMRFMPVFRPTRLHAPRRMRVPAAYDPNDPKTIGHKNVFTGSMTDLFGKWVPQDWIDAVFAEVVRAPEWNFLFLTKFPQRLAEQDWPSNAWVGASVDRQARVATAERSFRGVKAGVRWLSCEPLLERLTFTDLSMFDWVVIGAQTANEQVAEFQPPWEWVHHLERQARDAGCKVYMKPNLTSRTKEYPSGSIRETSS